MRTPQIKSLLGIGNLRRLNKIGSGADSIRTFENKDTGELLRTNDRGEVLTHCLKGYYFAFGHWDDGPTADITTVIITPAGLWGRQHIMDDTSSADYFLPPEFQRLSESVYETRLDEDAARALLVKCGAVENPKLGTEDE